MNSRAMKGNAKNGMKLKAQACQFTFVDLFAGCAGVHVDGFGRRGNPCLPLERASRIDER